MHAADLVDEAQEYYNRSQWFENIFDNKTKFCCARSTNGELSCPNEIERLDPFDRCNTEGDAWHYRFFVPHNIKRLIKLFGGQETFVIVKFDSKETFLKEYTMPENEQPMNTPIILLFWQHLILIVCFDDGIDNDKNEGQVKVILGHLLMRTVYTIHYDPNQHHLYAVSGRNGKSPVLGFIFSVHPESFGELIAMWEKFSEPYDLALSVNGRSLFVSEIRPNRIDSFDVLN